MAKITKVPFSHKVAAFFDIPLDTVIDWPRVILSGNQSLVVQNHRGVIEYDRGIARINTKLGELVVSGSGLTLVSAVKEEIVIEGKVERVELVDWR